MGKLNISCHGMDQGDNMRSERLTSYEENFRVILAMTCNPTTENINPKLRTNTTTGSTFSPGLSSVYSFNIVPDEPPAPAARVDVGRAFFTDSLWSAAARRRSAARGPPGGVGEEGRFKDEAALPDAALAVLPPDLGLSGPESGPDVRGEVEAWRI